MQNSQNINKIYDKLNYFDYYGSSIFGFLIFTFVYLIVIFYFVTMQNLKEIKEDWINQRCNPKYMAFAGFIQKPDNKTAIEYTGENFTYCVQDILTSITGYVLQPFNQVMTQMTQNFSELSDSVNDSRKMIGDVRNNSTNNSVFMYNKLFQLFQFMNSMILSIKNSLLQSQMTMFSGFSTILNSFYTLESNVPIGRCFDENTLIEMNDGSKKKISSIEIGDVLKNDNKVTATFVLDSVGLDMYKLPNNICVSDNHLINYEDNWIPIRKFPGAKKIYDHDSYVYCLNTTSKKIEINDYIFTDWDELYGEKLDKILQKVGKCENIHKYLDGGFHESTMISLKNNICVPINTIKVGSILQSNEIVYGIVKIDGSSLLNDCYEYTMSNNEKIVGVQLKPTINIPRIKIGECPNILYHILTCSKKVSSFEDYNSNIDAFFE